MESLGFCCGLVDLDLLLLHVPHNHGHEEIDEEPKRKRFAPPGRR